MPPSMAGALLMARSSASQVSYSLPDRSASFRSVVSSILADREIPQFFLWNRAVASSSEYLLTAGRIWRRVMSSKVLPSMVMTLQ